jgi:hypothetical protein
MYPPFTTSVTIPKVYIKSSELAQLQNQQQTIEANNLSLTLLLLFFASLDVALALSERALIHQNCPKNQK